MQFMKKPAQKGPCSDFPEKPSLSPAHPFCLFLTHV